MANYEATKYAFDGQSLTGVTSVSTGIVLPWSDSSLPSGFLECNGSAVSRSTYSGLFAVIGTTYGSGNGSTTFNVPDLKDKCVGEPTTLFIKENHEFYSEWSYYANSDGLDIRTTTEETKIC